MTSHHDVAVVVAELRIGFDVSPAIAERAAALLESQAKALSEAETAILRTVAVSNGHAARALAAEARLAEAMKVIEPIADGSIDIGGTAIIIGSDARAIIQAARAFTNAAKTQESKDA